MKCKIGILLLLFASLFGALSLGANAGEDVLSRLDGPENTYEMNAGPYYEQVGCYTDMETLRVYLNEQLRNCVERIDLSSFSLPAYSDVADALAFYVYKDIPEAFHVECITSYSYDQSSMTLVDMFVSYSLDAKEYEGILSQCEEVAGRMLEGLDAQCLSQAEKALILHDRLAIHCEYDLSQEGEYTFDMVGAFLNRSAVCEGYAMAYSYLLDRVGIRNYYCSSELLVHGWNIVDIDGVPYHVDVTWDDMVPDITGQVAHRNFLRSTVGMIETGHVKDGYIDYEVTPSDTRFDEYYWQTSNSEFQLVGGEIYYIDNGKKTLCRVEEGEDLILCSVEDLWMYGPFYSWDGNFARLSFDGTDLLYSLSTGVFRYDLSENTVVPIYEPALAEKFCIFGFTYEDGYLVCDLSDTPDFSATTGEYQIKVSYTLPSQESAVPGDLDGVEGVTSDDAVYLLFHTLFAERYPVDQTCDFDKSGVVNSDDAVYLLFHTLFPSRYPIA